MAHRFRRARHSLTSVSEIDITPLIDLAFSLLIIFMIATPLLEQTIPLNLPQESAKPQATPEKVDYQVISINAQSQTFWGTELVSTTQLLTKLQALAAIAKPPVIHLRADATLHYGRVVEVIDSIKRAGLKNISLDTQAK